MRDLRIRNKPETSCEDFEVFDIRNYDKTLNTDKIPDCDCFIDLITYNNVDKYKIVHNLDELRYKRGNGIIIKKDKERVLAWFKSVDWVRYAYKSPNGSYNLTGSDIITAYKDNK